MSQPLFLGMRKTCLAVRDVEAAAERFGRAFGVTPKPVAANQDPGVTAKFSSVRIGDQSLVLMEDLRPDGAINRFIERRGEGLFSVLVQVSDVEAAMAHMREQGFGFVEDRPRRLDERDDDGNPVHVDVAWLHPRDAHGLLIEFQQFHG